MSIGLGSKKILVLGVGRSGTTAIYSLLQKIFEDQYPQQTDYVYEPFLWDRNTFNKHYLKITNEFHVADAVSVEGMYHHRQIPLFCDQQADVAEASANWLQTLFTCPEAAKSHSIVKMIRANGRIDLIRQIVPEVKIIALLRNPLDVINSAIHRFSFFGDEFHQSDFNRFRQELSLFQNVSAAQLPDADDVVGKETAFWYAMNQHLVDRLEHNHDQVLPVVYEQFDRHREQIVEEICHFVGVDVQPAYSQHVRNSVGPVTGSEVNLTARQYLTVESKLAEYATMVSRLTDYDVSDQLHAARERFISSSFREQGIARSHRFNSLYAQNQLKKKESQIANLQGVEARLVKLEGTIQEYESTIRDQLALLSSKDLELTGLGQKLSAHTETVERLQEKVFAKSMAVETKQQELIAKSDLISELQQKNESEFALTLQQGIELTNRDATIRKQQEAIKEKDNALRGYEQELTSQHDWVGKLESELAASSKLLLKRETEIAEKNELILRQQASLQEMDQKNAELEAAIAAHQEELHCQHAELRAEHASTRKREHELQQSLSERQRVLDQQQQQARRLQDRVELLTESLQRNARTREEMETRLTGMSREIRGRDRQLTEQNQSHQKVIDALKTDICVRNQKINEMNELLSGLRQVTSYPISRLDRKLRAYRKLLQTYDRVKPEWHSKKNPEVNKRRRRRLKKRIDSRGVNLGDQTTAFFGNHRCGWSFAVESLGQINNPGGIYLDTFIERTFCWSPEGVRTHQYPWIGFIHVPPFVPGWFQYKQSNQAIFESEAWQESLPYCRGLFTLSDYHKEHLQLKFDFPIESVIHPTEIPNQLWSWEAFCNNRDKRIIQLGWWLRKLHAIYQLPDSLYRKTLIRVNEKEYLKDLFRREKELLVSSGEFDESMYDSVDILNFVPNEKYDQLLSRNLVFLNLYDSSANNSVIECIARGTPLLINPIAPVKEYLGEDYPLYYDSYEEAIEKASDLELIRQTHEYLMQCLTRKKLTGEYFKQSVQGSSLLLNAYQA